ncbi:MAG: hypothetical protein EA369_04640 [Bradymonadales bacterium]|nr:MAG: hypothetical protein EA369_04640 [Bradymonadales bacterium]
MPTSIRLSLLSTLAGFFILATPPKTFAACSPGYRDLVDLPHLIKIAASGRVIESNADEIRQKEKSLALANEEKSVLYRLVFEIENYLVGAKGAEPRTLDLSRSLVLQSVMTRGPGNFLLPKNWRGVLFFEELDPPRLRAASQSCGYGWGFPMDGSELSTKMLHAIQSPAPDKWFACQKSSDCVVPKKCHRSVNKKYVSDYLDYNSDEAMPRCYESHEVNSACNNNRCLAIRNW